MIQARDARFYRAAATTALAMAGIVVFLFLLRYQVIWMLLLGFAGVLVGVLLRALADLLDRRTGLGPRWSLAAVVLTLGVLLTLATWLAARPIGREAAQLTERLPRAVEGVRRQLEQHAWGRSLVAAAGNPQQMLGGGGGGAGGEGASLFQRATGLVGGVLDVVVLVVVVFFVGLFLAIEPQLYIEGIVRLFPCRRRKRAREVLATVGYSLRWWLIGQGITMIIIGILTTAGLYMLGVPLALLLGLLAAAFNFVPNFGPLVSAVPAVLLALTVSPSLALWVVLLYVVLQTLEGYVITPLVQRKAVLMPPALTILMQVVLGYLVGVLGVLLAAPLTAASVVIVKMLYVEDVLDDDDVEVPGEEEAKEEEGRKMKAEG